MNWKSPNAFARATMQNPLGMPPAQTRGRVQVPLGITLGDPARPVIPKRALVRGPGGAMTMSRAMQMGLVTPVTPRGCSEGYHECSTEGHCCKDLGPSKVFAPPRL